MGAKANQCDTPSMQVTHNQALGIITFSNPHEGNAFSDEFPAAFYSVVSAMIEDSSVRVLIIRAEGKVFSAGAHFDVLSGDGGGGDKDELSFIERLNSCIELLITSPKPSVVALSGAAAGGGASLALAGDFLIASPNARLLFPFINLGLVPDTGCLWTLTRRIGLAKAKEIVFLGKTLCSEEAVTLGLVDRLVSLNDLDRTVLDFGRQLAEKPAGALAATKKLCNALASIPFEEYAAMESQAVNSIAQTAEFKEQIQVLIAQRGL
jgi:enoyl-CoA hydratase/carnithine racemase